MARDLTSAAIKVAIKARKVVMIVGDPGTGKTETVRAIARDINYELITLLGSQMDPTDITGLPKGEHIMDDEKGNPVYGTVFLAPWWQVRIMQEKRVLLYLDEFSNTSGAVRASMLTMLQNREFPNGMKMPRETIVLGSMNPQEQAADGYELDLPTTNRMVFISWSPLMSDWMKGMLNNWGNPASPEELKWKQRIVGFIEDNGHYLHKLPDETELQDARNAYGLDPSSASDMEVLRCAWPSRRSWDSLSKLLMYVDDEDTALQDKLAEGTVGYAAAQAFREWLRSHESFSVREVLEHPEQVPWSTINLNDSNLIMRGVVSNITAENATQVIKVFEAIADAERLDLGGPYIKHALKGLNGKHIPKNVREENSSAIRQLLVRYHTVARLAGQA